MVEEKELQEKVILHRLIGAKIESLLRQRESLLQILDEVEETIKGIEEIEKENEDFLFSIGSQTYIPCKIADKKLIVELGANIAIEKNLEEGKQILDKRRGEILKSIESIEVAINQLSSSLKELEEEIKKMIEKRKS